jgi:hypothetical protein
MRNVDKDGVATFGAAVRVVLPNETTQLFGGNPWAPFHSVKDSLLNWRQGRQL